MKHAGGNYFAARMLMTSRREARSTDEDKEGQTPARVATLHLCTESVLTVAFQDYLMQ
jgi:hypothetical protein